MQPRYIEIMGSALGDGGVGGGLFPSSGLRVPFVLGLVGKSSHAGQGSTRSDLSRQELELSNQHLQCL